MALMFTFDIPSILYPDSSLESVLKVNPYKPSVLFVGHSQTVQTQTRHRRKQSLIKVSTICL